MVETPGNVVCMAEHRRRRKPAERAIAARETGSYYFCLRCETDRFRLYATGLIHCAQCGALMRNLLVNPSSPPA
jgi:hypothetical protein